MGKHIVSFVVGAGLAAGITVAHADKIVTSGAMTLYPEKRIEAPGGVGTLYEIQGNACNGDKCSVLSVQRCRDAQLAKCYALLSGHITVGKSQHPSACK